MQGKNLVRRQHVVSKFYLKGFANDIGKGQLLRVPLPGENSYRVSVNDATVQKDFYSLTNDRGELDDSLEEAFSRIEDEAAKALQAILIEPGMPIGIDDKRDFSYWLAVQYLRTVGFRQLEQESESQIIRAVVGQSGKAVLKRHIERFEGHQVSPDRLEFEWTELTKDGGPTLKSGAEYHQESLLDGLYEFSWRVFQSQWVLESYSDEVLLTGDHPVILLESGKVHGRDLVGTLSARILSVPLSRKLGLTVYLDSIWNDRQITGDLASSRERNQLLIDNTRQTLLLHPEDSSLVDEYELPAERNFELDPSIGRALIREEGNFGDVSPEEAHRRNLLPAIWNRYGKSLTIEDIPWPISRRVNRWIHRTTLD
ncbi:DUF4238 domain-containing protein [Glutamicibacter sp. 287]|uniref:DUF4238 domain-containing protein n=1 Tax=unclassified Glutamicibacter TaxID=2627139 RepID=UPI000BB76D1F|nr:DUF4238 domain-containing protein [Glutamicibacter sp. BW80]PCC27078.1 hypothetical protein CIK76_18715 [Glutamicibacter sp. BW80]